MKKEKAIKSRQKDAPISSTKSIMSLTERVSDSSLTFSFPLLTFHRMKIILHIEGEHSTSKSTKKQEKNELRGQFFKWKKKKKKKEKKWVKKKIIPEVEIEWTAVQIRRGIDKKENMRERKYERKYEKER